MVMTTMTESVVGSVPITVDGMGGIAVTGEEHLIVESTDYSYPVSRKRFTSWFVLNGVPVGMIHFLMGGNEVPVLCDIEIREEYRGRGLSRRFVSLLEEFVVEGTLYTSGHYTPEGFRSLSSWLPLKPDAAEYGDTAAIYFRSMNFVTNWDNFWT